MLIMGRRQPKMLENGKAKGLNLRQFGILQGCQNSLLIMLSKIQKMTSMVLF